MKSGSIPARAGEPHRLAAAGRLPRVYPRACGGTASPRRRQDSPSGLSPRVRGNLRVRRVVGQRRGSIPARAGEPRSRHTPPARDRVYPRACGGTTRRCTSASTRAGLSPRVRGNPQGAQGRERVRGSIPARAGEPDQGGTHDGIDTVYPRACGGTVVGIKPRPSFSGLSPRVRGNPADPVAAHGGAGSIPARAGEPTLHAVEPHKKGVYPRACGGTAPSEYVVRRIRGLSPRVRGNPLVPLAYVVDRGSIPARAGEPIL